MQQLTFFGIKILGFAFISIDENRIVLEGPKGRIAKRASYRYWQGIF